MYKVRGLLQAEETGWVHLGHLVDVGLGEALLLETVEQEYQRIWVERVGRLTHIGGEDAMVRTDCADGFGVVGEVELL